MGVDVTSFEEEKKAAQVKDLCNGWREKYDCFIA